MIDDTTNYQQATDKLDKAANIFMAENSVQQQQGNDEKKIETEYTVLIPINTINKLVDNFAHANDNIIVRTESGTTASEQTFQATYTLLPGNKEWAVIRWVVTT